jgi:predicted RNA polymerase sigma factor
MKFENELNAVLEKLRIPLKAVWVPSDSSKEHARIDLENSIIMIFDKDQTEAINSLIHEVLEYRIRKVTSPYRHLVNALIESVEAEVYSQKEKALDEILNDFKVLKKLGEK